MKAQHSSNIFYNDLFLFFIIPFCCDVYKVENCDEFHYHHEIIEKIIFELSL